MLSDCPLGKTSPEVDHIITCYIGKSMPLGQLRLMHALVGKSVELYGTAKLQQ